MTLWRQDPALDRRGRLGFRQIRIRMVPPAASEANRAEKSPFTNPRCPMRHRFHPSAPGLVDDESGTVPRTNGPAVPGETTSAIAANNPGRYSAKPRGAGRPCRHDPGAGPADHHRAPRGRAPGRWSRGPGAGPVVARAGRRVAAPGTSRRGTSRRRRGMVRADGADGQPFTRCTLAAARDADSIAPCGDGPRRMSSARLGQAWPTGGWRAFTACTNGDERRPHELARPDPRPAAARSYTRPGRPEPVRRAAANSEDSRPWPSRTSA
jgi:hypothetical protein